MRMYSLAFFLHHAAYFKCNILKQSNLLRLLKNSMVVKRDNWGDWDDELIMMNDVKSVD